VKAVEGEAMTGAGIFVKRILGWGALTLASGLLAWGAHPAQAAERDLPAPAYAGPLYTGPAEGSQQWKYDRIVTGAPGSENVHNTREPRLEVYLPAAGKANGAGVIMLPGGGLRVLGTGKGMDDEIRAFLDHGVAVILLEYRTLQVDPEVLARPPAPRPAGAEPMKFPKLEIRSANANPAPNDAALAEVLRLATADGQAALALAHSNAQKWGLDPDRIGMIGTSAGGGVAFGALMAGGPPETTPDFIISIFGPALQDMTADENSPPLFLVTEADHGPVTDGLLALFSMWKDADRKVELHVYEVPNFSMTVDLWGGRLFDWMEERGLLKRGGAQ